MRECAHRLQTRKWMLFFLLQNRNYFSNSNSKNNSQTTTSAENVLNYLNGSEKKLFRANEAKPKSGCSNQ